MFRHVKLFEFLAQRLFSSQSGYRLLRVTDCKAVSSLIEPSIDSVDCVYTVHNQWQLKDAIGELPEGHGLYDPTNKAYVLINRFLWDFDENQDPSGYNVHLVKVVD